jgi:hypothetical protein
MKVILIILITALVLFITMIWYKIKFILDENDYHVDYFFQHFTDIPNFIKLIRKEKERSSRKSYIYLLVILFTSLGVAITCFIYLLKKYG